MMVPPSMRKGTPGVVPAAGTTPVTAGVTPDESKSFEDKRRENFNKGQVSMLYTFFPTAIYKCPY